VPRLTDQIGAPATTGDPDEDEDTDTDVAGNDDEDEADSEPPGRTPEQKVEDVVADTASDFSQHCHWKGVAGADRIAALEKLGEWVESELKKATTDLLQSQQVKVAPTTILAPPETPQPRGEKKKGGRPKGSKNKPEVAPPPPPTPPVEPTPAPARAGNDTDTEASTEARKAGGARNAAGF
jgi:hypothetical protein